MMISDDFLRIPEAIAFGHSLKENDLGRFMAASADRDLFMALGAAFMPDIALYDEVSLFHE